MQWKFECDRVAAIQLYYRTIIIYYIPTLFVFQNITAVEGFDEVVVKHVDKL